MVVNLIRVLTVQFLQRSGHNLDIIDEIFTFLFSRWIFQRKSILWSRNWNDLA